MDFHQTWYGIANGQILSLTKLSAHDTSIFLFQANHLSKSQWIFTKLDMCIDIVQVLSGYIISIFDSYLPSTNKGEVLSFHTFIFFHRK